MDYAPFKEVLAQDPSRLNAFGNLFKDQLGIEELEALKALHDRVLGLNKTGEKMRTFSTMDFGFPVEYVDTEEKLISACERIKAHRVICFDVEFTDLESQDLPKHDQHSIRSVCASIQIATVEQAYFFDCLALNDLSKSALKPNPLTKAWYHAYDEDESNLPRYPESNPLGKHLGPILESDSHLFIFHSPQGDIYTIH